MRAREALYRRPPRWARGLTAVAATLLTATLASGCSSSSSSSHSASIPPSTAAAAATATPVGTLKVFFRALFANDGAAACKVLGPLAAKQIAGAGQASTCSKGVLLISSDYNHAQIQKLEALHTPTNVAGNTASVTYPSASNGAPVTFVFVRTAGGWQISRVPGSKDNPQVAGPF